MILFAVGMYNAVLENHRKSELFSSQGDPGQNGENGNRGRQGLQVSCIFLF